MISAVAEQYQIHPQTLRLYEREGLLKPSRSEGNTRLYTQEDLQRLEVILKLTRDFGVNLAGVEIILNMREKMAAIERQVEEFVRTLNEELAVHLPAPSKEERNSLIPVITLPSVTPVRRESKKGAGEAPPLSSSASRPSTSPITRTSASR
jgi:MerR family transcriptional regulator/heat shock protein HspR